MGNQQCCQAKSLENENKLTAFPLADSSTVRQDSPSRKSPTEKSSVGKENAKEAQKPTLRSLESTDSAFFSCMFNELKLEVSSKGLLLTLFAGNPECTEVLTVFEQELLQLANSKGEMVRQIDEAQAVSQQFVPILNIYRSKLKSEFAVVESEAELRSAFVSKNGFEYQGDLKEGVANGLGRIFKQKKLLFEGRISNNLPNGLGIMFYSNSLVYYGQFENGRRNGSGVLDLRSAPVCAQKVQGTVEGRRSARQRHGVLEVRRCV